MACYGLARGLAAAGVKIGFALPRRLGVEIPFLQLLEHELQNVEVTAINSLMASYMGVAEYNALRVTGRAERMRIYGNSLLDEAMRYGEMAAEWSRSQPHDIIHAHDWMTFPAGMRAKEVSGKPLVTHVHATEYDRTGGSVNSDIADIEYEGLNKADRVIAVSEYTKNIVRQYYGIAAEKIHVVHNGVNFDEFSPMQIRQIFPNDKIVLYVGRLTLQKGVDYFGRAAEKVLAAEPKTIFLVVGSGDMERRLIMEAAFRGIGHRIIFAGFLTGEKLRMCYQMADVFVMPSVSEPYGLVALEAIAAGVPVIISKQSGVAETLSSVLKVDFWDIDRIAQMIIEVLEYPNLAAEMVAAAKLEAAKMTWESAAYKTLAVYRQLI